MNVQEGKRFRRSFYGYNRAAVDAEFGRLISQTDTLLGERETMQSQISALNEDKDFLHREQARLNASLSTSTTQIVELESSLARAKGENDSLSRAVEAHKAENNALQLRCEQLRERDRDFSMREREFAELQGSVSSIMSVTKRAADRLFQKAVDNQEQVTQIAGDAAREVAAIRADMNRVREQLNEALDMVQDRIDRVDASLTGAVHKLVAIKHDDGLQMGDQRPSILDEVEHLLNLRAGENDGAYSVPALGPYSAKLVADTAQRVNDGRITAKPSAWDGVEVKKVVPGSFSSSGDSMLEANKLLERGGVSAEEYYDANPQFVPQPVEKEEAPAVEVKQEIGFVAEPDQPDDIFAGDDTAIPMPPPHQYTQSRIGFSDPDEEPAQEEAFDDRGEDYFFDNGFSSGEPFQPAQIETNPTNGGFFDRGTSTPYAAGSMFVGDVAGGTVSGYGSYSFRPYEEQVSEPESQIVRPAMRKGRAAKKVAVRPVVRRK